ncbi:MAG: hypothetical protein ABIC82_06425, partial [bacterium]
DFLLLPIEYIAIKNVQAGDYVLSLNEKTGLLEPAKINGLLDMGVKPIYKLTTESGKTIRTTGNHPYLSRKQENNGTRKQLISDVFSSRDFNNAEQIFALGNIKDNSDMKTDAETILAETTGEFFDIPMLKRMIEPGKIAKFIFNFGLDKNRQPQNLLLNFFIDDELKHNNYATDPLRAFLRSLNNSSPLIQPSLASASAMIEAYRACAAGELNSLSHSSNLSLVNSNINSSKAATDSLVLGRKTPTMDSSLMSRGCDNCDNLVRVFMDLDDNKLSNDNYSKQWSELSNSSWIKVVELSVGDEIAVFSFGTRNSEFGGVEFEKIVSIEILPPEQVYDIEVEGTHKFVANDIIAHNTYIHSVAADADVKGLEIAQSGAVSGTGYSLYVANLIEANNERELFENWKLKIH